MQFAKNNIAQAPQNNSYINQAEQEIEKQKDVPSVILSSENDLKGFALDITIKYGLDFKKFNYTIQNESGYNPLAKSKNGLCLGVSQYLLSTWIGNCTVKDERTDPYKSIECMGKMWSQGLQYQWDAYCCKYEDLKCKEKRNLYPGSILCT